MKKLMYFALILVLVAGVSLFGAMAPVQEETETRYADAPIVSPYVSESIYYTTKDYTTVKTDGGVPEYTNATGYNNACGAVAGAEIVAFYDKYYPNLIPGWDSYFPSNGNYRGQTSAYVTPLMNELYELMQINVKADGVSESDFKSGLQTYFTNHGYRASFQNVKGSYAVSLTACTAAFSSNKVVVLFTTAGDVYDIAETAYCDAIIPYTISGNHVMIAYGSVEVNYYDALGGLFRSDYYLLVATGRDFISTAYYRINSSNLEAAYVVNVA